MTINRTFGILVVSATVMVGALNPALAETDRSCVDWKKLSLSAPQSQQIQSLEQDWNGKYLKIQPDILDQQRKLTKLLMDPKSDPLEIMSTQQNIARLREQLRNEATANYLKKRAILNVEQQRQLEFMMQQMVAERQRGTGSMPQAEEQGGFMELIQKVRWAIQAQPGQGSSR